MYQLQAQPVVAFVGSFVHAEQGGPSAKTENIDDNVLVPWMSRRSGHQAQVRGISKHHTTTSQTLTDQSAMRIKCMLFIVLLQAASYLRHGAR